MVYWERKYPNVVYLSATETYVRSHWSPVYAGIPHKSGGT
jgi:hypothetical protein